VLAKEIFPVAAPLVWGTNTTSNVELFPAGMVKGNDTPLKLNSELFKVADFTVTLVPLALRVTGVLLLFPTVTLPKFKVAGLKLSAPAGVPVPVSAALTAEPPLAGFRDSVPLELPVLVGAKTRSKVKLCPAVRTSGRFSPLKLKPLPVNERVSMLNDPVPEFVMVSGRVLLFPTCTFPKPRLPGDSFTLADACWIPVPEKVRKRTLSVA
jgi:hypothetical protein